jgi:hypothetical protein
MSALHTSSCSLICEDYIKLKGSLFFRLAVAVTDPDEDVASLGLGILT